MRRVFSSFGPFTISVPVYVEIHSVRRREKKVVKLQSILYIYGWDLLLSSWHLPVGTTYLGIYMWNLLWFWLLWENGGVNTRKKWVFSFGKYFLCKVFFKLKKKILMNFPCLGGFRFNLQFYCLCIYFFILFSHFVVMVFIIYLMKYNK